MIWISLAVVLRKIVIVSLNTVYTVCFDVNFCFVTVTVIAATDTTLVTWVLIAVVLRFVIVCLHTVYTISRITTRLFLQGLALLAFTLLVLTLRALFAFLELPSKSFPILGFLFILLGIFVLLFFGHTDVSKGIDTRIIVIERLIIPILALFESLLLGEVFV